MTPPPGFLAFVLFLPLGVGYITESLLGQTMAKEMQCCFGGEVTQRPWFLTCLSPLTCSVFLIFWKFEYDMCSAGVFLHVLILVFSELPESVVWFQALIYAYSHHYCFRYFSSFGISLCKQYAFCRYPTVLRYSVLHLLHSLFILYFSFRSL